MKIKKSRAYFALWIFFASWTGIRDNGGVCQLRLVNDTYSTMILFEI